jgi:hypothetical protein
MRLDHVHARLRIAFPLIILAIAGCGGSDDITEVADTVTEPSRPQRPKSAIVGHWNAIPHEKGWVVANDIYIKESNRGLLLTYVYEDKIDEREFRIKSEKLQTGEIDIVWIHPKDGTDLLTSTIRFNNSRTQFTELTHETDRKVPTGNLIQYGTYNYVDATTNF